MKSYEFNITVIGTGKDVDDAFSNALNKLSEDAGSAIEGEVIYVSISNSQQTDLDSEEKLEN